MFSIKEKVNEILLLIVRDKTIIDIPRMKEIIANIKIAMYNASQKGLLDSKAFIILEVRNLNLFFTIKAYY